MNIDPKELAMGIAAEKDHEHDKAKMCNQDDALAKTIALRHLKEDPRYYTKLKASGLDETTDEGALTPTERGFDECCDMDSVAIAPSVPVVKISVPTSAVVGGGQTKLTSSGLGQSGSPKPLKSDNLDAPPEKAKVGANKVAMSKTPTITGQADPLNHFGSQIMEKF